VSAPQSWRKAIAVAIGAAILAAGTQLGMDPQTIAWIGGLISALIIGQGVVDYFTKIPNNTYGWRRIFAGIAGAIVLTLGPQIGLSPSACQWITTILGAFIVGQSVADAKVQPA